MYGSKSKLAPTAEDKTDTSRFWTRLVPTPEGMTKAVVYYISCAMPEATQITMDKFPVPPAKSPDTLRILVVAGNLTKYAGDALEVITSHFLSTWDFLVYVPGPFEYAHGTIEMGDDFTKIMNTVEHRFVVLGTGENMTRCVHFVGPQLVLIGAPLWPLETELYKKIGVYEESANQTTAPGARQAVENGRIVRGSMLKFRMMRDVRDLIKTLDGRLSDKETRIVVSYGCPTPLISSNINLARTIREYDGTVTIKEMDQITPRIDRWIYGANGDDGAVHRVDKVFYHRNQYTLRHQSFETPNPITVVPKK